MIGASVLVVGAGAIGGVTAAKMSRTSPASPAAMALTIAATRAWWVRSGRDGTRQGSGTAGAGA